MLEVEELVVLFLIPIGIKMFVILKKSKLQYRDTDLSYISALFVPHNVFPFLWWLIFSKDTDP